MNISLGQFPSTRLRRPRMHDWSRRLVQEHSVRVDDLIWPIFIMEGDNQTQKIDSMPGVSRLTIDRAVAAAQEAESIGIPVIALFPATPPRLKTDDGREAYNPNNLICQTVKAIKSTCKNIGVMCDVALDPYTTHGHDGVIIHDEIANDATVEILVQQALTLAQAGADIIAPSDMQDGRIGAIRTVLESHKFHNTLILSYAAKYASKFYGPFRHAVGSATNNLGIKDKRSYQQDPANADEALREVALDIQEGADMVMVKPGMPYLDVVRRVRETFNLPTFAYEVSGEYAMRQAAIQNGWLDQAVTLETMICFKRAGASGILTYSALDIARRLADTKVEHKEMLMPEAVKS